MKHLKTILILTVLLSSCSATGENKPVPAEISSEENESLSSTPAVRQNQGKKMIGNSGYTVRVVSALDFLERKGEKVTAEDRKSLEKEAVALLEIETANPKQDFFDAPGIAFSKE